MKRNGWVFLLAAWAVGASAPASANDPNTTVTIYVHGFDQLDADHGAVYGETIHEALIDSVAALVGLPVVAGTDGLPPNATLAVGYNGDTPPSYYSPADVAEVDGITAQWGGGVPRYAAIVAKYARHVLQQSGAQNLNFVSGSFGSLIVRWLIEKDVEGLAGEGRIARWLTAEGLVAGNWAASRDEVADFLDFLQLLPVEVQHMDYAWVESHLHAPRIEADNPLYAGILVGQIASTSDSYQDGALSTLMAGYGEYQPNDGVQALGDAYFHTMTPASRLFGMEPTLGLFHVNHYELSHHRGAWANAATFITQRRRVRVVMTSATVSDMHEAHQPFWDWRPAEVVFGSRAYSPAVQARWGIGDPCPRSEGKALWRPCADTPTTERPRTSRRWCSTISCSTRRPNCASSCTPRRSTTICAMASSRRSGIRTMTSAVARSRSRLSSLGRTRFTPHRGAVSCPSVC